MSPTLGVTIPRCRRRYKVPRIGPRPFDPVRADGVPRVLTGRRALEVAAAVEQVGEVMRHVAPGQARGHRTRQPRRTVEAQISETISL